jgi:hypothetical protein
MAEELNAAVAEVEGSATVIYTAAAPGEFNAPKHVPGVTIADGKCTVVIAHGKH